MENRIIHHLEPDPEQWGTEPTPTIDVAMKEEFQRLTQEVTKILKAEKNSPLENSEDDKTFIFVDGPDTDFDGDSIEYPYTPSDFEIMGTPAVRELMERRKGIRRKINMLRSRKATVENH